MKEILFVEDETDFRESIGRRLAGKFVISAADVSSFAVKPNKGEVTEQLKEWFVAQFPRWPSIEGALLDTDLSGYQNGIAKESLLAVFRTLGLPVCRYSKRQAVSGGELLKQFAGLSVEGPLSLLVPGEAVAAATDVEHGDDAFVDWVVAAFHGFNLIHEKYQGLATTGEGAQFSPAAILSKVLEDDALELDLLGYMGANLFFFGDKLVEEGKPANSEASNLLRSNATKLGYWLKNYIMAFPGPILNFSATAAVLGVKSNTVDPLKFANAFADCSYHGPFSGCGHYFKRSNVEELLLGGKTGTEILEQRGLASEALYPEDPSRSGVYCIITDASLKSEDAVGPLDWIPGGASELCRVERKTYQKLSPWMNI